MSDRLAEPFEPREVKFKPQAVKGNKALAIAYVDVRLIEDRLDAVLGVENWQDDYEIVGDGSVTCKLRINLGGEWITKMDVGSPSEQPDGGDRLKAAFSDALKRTAVKFGIGRYLYRLPGQWVDYDPVKKQIVRTPQLPAFALPGSAARKQAERVAAQVPGVTTGDALPDPVRQWADFLRGDPPLGDLNAKLPELSNLSKAAKGEVWKAVTDHAAAIGWVWDAARKTYGPAQAEPGGDRPNGLPADGTELHRRLQDYDAKLAAQKACPRGALLAHVTQVGVRAGYSPNLTEWAGPAIAFAVETVKEFEAQLKQPAAR